MHLQSALDDDIIPDEEHEYLETLKDQILDRTEITARIDVQLSNDVRAIFTALNKLLTEIYS